MRELPAPGGALHAIMQPCNHANPPCGLPTDCLVPRQMSTTNASNSILNTTKLAHGTEGAPFPFYTRTEVPAGQSCASVRVWGSCSCDDGTLNPGCNASDSSSWMPLDKSAATLPAGLSLTCVTQTGAAGPGHAWNVHGRRMERAWSRREMHRHPPSSNLPTNNSPNPAVCQVPFQTSSDPGKSVTSVRQVPQGSTSDFPFFKVEVVRGRGG